MRLPRMSLHIGDYRKDTGHLRAAGHGAYLLLIMHYWATGGLPDDDRQLATIACMSTKEWKHWGPIVRAFFEPNMKHGRIEEEFGVALEKYERRAAAGKKGGLVPKTKQCESNASPMPKQPITLTNKEKEDGGRDARARDPAFDLCQQIAQIAGYPDATYWPPGWLQAPHRVRAFLDAGYTAETMLDAAREAMARKRDGPPGSIAYFEKPFARARALSEQPLPLVTILEPQRTATNGQHWQDRNRTSPITAAIDGHIERFEREARGDGEVYETPPRLLSDR
jgi:uncharacterized protein YdaU (DUF1376 family)